METLLSIFWDKKPNKEDYIVYESIYVKFETGRTYL